MFIVSPKQESLETVMHVSFDPGTSVHIASHTSSLA